MRSILCSSSRSPSNGEARADSSRRAGGRMRLVWNIDASGEEYFAQELWRKANLKDCPAHPKGGCGFARHGTYRRCFRPAPIPRSKPATAGRRPTWGGDIGAATPCSGSWTRHRQLPSREVLRLFPRALEETAHEGRMNVRKWLHVGRCARVSGSLAFFFDLSRRQKAPGDAGSAAAEGKTGGIPRSRDEPQPPAGTVRTAARR